MLFLNEVLYSTGTDHSLVTDLVVLGTGGGLGAAGLLSPTFSSPTSLLIASMVSSTSVPVANGQRVTLEGSFTLCVSCTT